MTATSSLRVALVGNPNCGKSSLFNHLTGLRQKTGNFPGVTVEKREGTLTLSDEKEIQLIDFPGAYSLYPNSLDERIVAQAFSNPNNPDFPDVVVYVADVTRLDKHLLLLSQLCDLQIPILLALNMADIAAQEAIQVDTNAISRFFGIPVLMVSGRTGLGMETLKETLLNLPPLTIKKQYTLTKAEKKLADALREIVPLRSDYQALLLAHHHNLVPELSDPQKEAIISLLKNNPVVGLKRQVEETLARYESFTPIIHKAVRKPENSNNRLTSRLDRILTNRLAGPVIFFVLMALVFQSIFAWASYPMDWIEGGIAQVSALVNDILPEGWVRSLITEGLLAGLSGILVFVPQIAILFFLISILEEVGYMARAAFIFDRLMSWFGLNGRSVVALISGGACAIPAIMSARTIGNWKERLITILVTPFISCSARIPVYTVLIGFAVPAKMVWGIFNLQGLAFMGLYVLGILAALLSALVMKWVLKTGERSFLMLELPQYRSPVLRNVGLTVWEKVRAFVVEAGKIIMVISLVLWVLSSYGPPGKMEAAERAAEEFAIQNNMEAAAAADFSASRRIEASWAGHLGKWIEPAIQPLGFDWKIGIALITSFAAREVFVGTMATIYSIGSAADDETTIRKRMALELRPDTGLPVYSVATSFSLLLFYVFAMQCMSTLAVVRRETGSWKWPAVQFVFMTALAYFSSLLVYQVMS